MTHPGNELEVYGKINYPILGRMLRYPATALASHWLFQGLLYMDKTERLFKLGLDAILTLTGYLVLQRWLSPAPLFGVTFFTAHTLNFLFNGQVWGVLKGYGMVEMERADFDTYTTGIVNRARREPSIDKLLLYGSLARKQWTVTSDFDARIVRKTGHINGLRACWFVLRERSLALFKQFPIDIYVLDSVTFLDKMRNDEEPCDLLHIHRNVDF